MQFDEGHVGYQLAVLKKLFQKQVDEHLRELGFSDASCMNGWILEYLSCQKGRVFQRDLEQMFHVGRSSMSATLKTMEERGYISRGSVSGDARLKQVTLTEKGIVFVREIEKGKCQLERKATHGLTEEELAQFFAVMRKMRENLETY